VTTPEVSPFERLGGETFVRTVVTRFIERVTSDLMIGFFFAGVDRERLTTLEFQIARQHLGGEGGYEGRPLRMAHGKHRIFGGHFNRRLVILGEVLSEFEIPLDIRESWLDHDRALRPLVEATGESECKSDALPSLPAPPSSLKP
jgi:hemoglobin